ncbi:putative Acetyltransferase [metagenome]|uniref:Putative Acetyltransferase n=1 Tax=metagenome TaxID=256318 RepID=A0A2P2C2R0_9ZZZZ
MDEGDVQAATTADREEILELITAEQADPSHAIPYLGEHRIGIEAELADLQPAWLGTARLARENGRLVGLALAEWDPEAGRAWIFGPWVAGASDDSWDRWSGALLGAVIEQLPAAVDDREICGDVANTRLARLAGDLGWAAGVVNHIFVADATAARSWPVDEAPLRPVTAADLPALRPLHDQEFPATYATADQLLTRATDGSWTVLVAEYDGVFAGYAAGHVQPDGDGFLSFLATTPEARGRGLGAALVAAVGRRLIETAPHANVNLTVEDTRAPARRLYERLGFRLEASLCAYRSRPSSR